VSARGDLSNEPLDAELAQYVAALRAVEAPSDATREHNLAGVHARIAPARGRRIALAVAALAVAAGVALAFGLRHRDVVRDDEPGPRQEAPYEHEDDAATGTAELAREAVSPAPDRSDARAVEPVPIEPSPPAVEPAAEIEPREPATKPTQARVPKPPEPTPSEPAYTLADELARIKAARAAVEGKRFDEVLGKLDAYDATYPKGAFAAESRLMRVEALCELGRTTQAIALRDAFLRKHPKSSLGPRMREACADAD